MEGEIIMRFIAGNFMYHVREVPDSSYGYVYKIYMDADTEFDEPILKYTVYRFSNVPVFVQNIQDSYALDEL